MSIKIKSEGLRNLEKFKSSLDSLDGAKILWNELNAYHPEFKWKFFFKAAVDYITYNWFKGYFFELIKEESCIRPKYFSRAAANRGCQFAFDKSKIKYEPYKCMFCYGYHLRKE